MSASISKTFEMAGAAKKRAQKERQAHRASEEASAQTSSVQASRPSPGGFDGPGDPLDTRSRSGSRPPSSAGAPPGHSGHSRHSSNAPPAYGPPAGGTSSRPGSSYGPPSVISRPSARDAPKPMKVGDVNRRLDLPGNAYNIGSEVSSTFLSHFSNDTCPHCISLSNVAARFPPCDARHIDSKRYYISVFTPSLLQHSLLHTAINFILLISLNRGFTS